MKGQNVRRTILLSVLAVESLDRSVVRQKDTQFRLRAIEPREHAIAPGTQQTSGNLRGVRGTAPYDRGHLIASLDKSKLNPQPGTAFATWGGSCGRGAESALFLRFTSTLPEIRYDALCMTQHRSPTGRAPRSDARQREPLPYFVTAAKGTEGLLKQELRELGILPVEGDRGGVHFGGGLENAFRVCLWSRIGVRVLERRFDASVRSDAELYDAVWQHDLSDVVDPSRTLAVTAMIKSSRMTHSQFVSRRVKDAIVDRQRDVFHRRSDVDASDPDVHFLIRLAQDEMTLYVDLSGEPLHRRGYRSSGGIAPIKENLAAALLRLGGYDGTAPLYDPCCGAGTILCEAALIAQKRAPGLGRARFGLERFVRFSAMDRSQCREWRDTARREALPQFRAVLAGGDIDLDAIDRARQSLRRLGVEAQLARRDVLQMQPFEQPGFVITNPPYGVRLEGGEQFDRRLAQALSRWKGHRVVVLTQERNFARDFGQRPTFEHTLHNGDLECRVFGWDLSGAPPAAAKAPTS
jgi:23S rRNA G2445 N2-methylase RlmL